MMKKISLLVSLFAILTITSALAQDFSGFRQSNYSGVSGGDWNPAMIADNRMVVDITLGGYGFKTRGFIAYARHWIDDVSGFHDVLFMR